MKAWLVTWEWMGDHAAVQDRIASILNPREVLPDAPSRGVRVSRP